MAHQLHKRIPRIVEHHHHKAEQCPDRNGEHQQKLYLSAFHQFFQNYQRPAEEKNRYSRSAERPFVKKQRHRRCSEKPPFIQLLIVTVKQQLQRQKYCQKCRIRLAHRKTVHRNLNISGIRRRLKSHIVHAEIRTGHKQRHAECPDIKRKPRQHPEAGVFHTGDRQKQQKPCI